LREAPTDDNGGEETEDSAKERLIGFAATGTGSSSRHFPLPVGNTGDSLFFFKAALKTMPPRIRGLLMRGPG
ncbi:hypothetical protein A2U01_0071548, partial [Trifolium medium]|nr:hypothetical protein [Trifolium medium]